MKYRMLKDTKKIFFILLPRESTLRNISLKIMSHIVLIVKKFGTFEGKLASFSGSNIVSERECNKARSCAATPVYRKKVCINVFSAEFLPSQESTDSLTSQYIILDKRSISQMAH